MLNVFKCTGVSNLAGFTVISFTWGKVQGTFKPSNIIAVIIVAIFYS